MPTEPTFDVALFRNKFDNVPRRDSWSLVRMENELGIFKERHEKNGPLWSPTSYPAGATRENEQVLAITCLVLDFDQGHAPDDLLDHWRGLGLAVFAHSSFSHTEGHPKWRAVMPLSRPVPASEWPEAYPRLVRRIASGLVDSSCSDPSRMYFLPSCPPGAARFAHAIPGRALDPTPTTEDARLLDEAKAAGDLDPTYERPKPRVRSGSGPETPGDWFNRTAVWRDLIEQAGGRYLGRHGAREHYVRAGKPKNETSATTGNGKAGQDLLVVHSPNWPGIPKGVYSRFGFYTRLHWDGDFVASARAIAAMPGFPKDQGGGTRTRPALPPGPPLDEPPLGIPYAAPAPDASAPRPIASVAEEDEPPDRYLDPDTGWRRKFGIGDVGNAERFVQWFGKDLRHVAGLGWYVWDGERWRKGDEGALAVRSKGMRVADRVVKAGLRAEDEESRKRLYALGAQLTEKKKMDPMLSLAAAFPQVEARLEDFDADPYLLGVRNGVVDLRTGELRPPSPDDMITMRSGCRYEERPCPTFLAFLDQIMLGRQDLMRFLMLSLGYSISGATSTRAFWFLSGSGGNGKGVLVKLFGRIVGDYGTTLMPESIMIRKNEQISVDLAKLQGKRFVAIPEVNDEKRLNEGLVKALSGFDEITARFMRENLVDFTPCAKIWMSGNQRPQVKNFDRPMRQRMRVVPFDLNLAVGEQDTGLADRLWDEAPGILWLIARAFAEYAKDGLPQTEAIEEATDAYQAAADSVTEFVETECDTTDPFSRTPRTEIFKSYVNWCRDNQVRPLGKQKMYERLAGLGIKTSETRLHGSPPFLGIRLLGESDYGTEGDE